MESAEPSAAPLLREDAERVAAAASPPTPRGTSEVTADSTGSASGAQPEPLRSCCVCLVKPPQVVLIPCGHACLCRKCAFKVKDCPVCRAPIRAQQRFYVG